jgi:cysteine desulfurase
MNVYFDNAATTPLHPKVIEKMNNVLSNSFGNPSSIHSYGRKVKVAVEEARETIADFINAKPSEIYFTSGGTESNNFIISGIARAVYYEQKKDEIISSNVEHHSILDTIDSLKINGIKNKLVISNKFTSSEINDIEELITENSSIVTIIYVNNETGTINPIDKFSSLKKEKNVLLHSDAVQALGKFKIDVQKLGIDSLTGSAHKINGPKGIGFAYIKSGTPITPLLFGGSQERNRRGGTENVAGIIGFAEAVKIKNDNLLIDFDNASYLKQKFIEGIKAIDSQHISINGGSKTSPFILNFNLDSDYYNTDSEALIMFLDINGVAVSSGSACMSGTIKASHVLLGAGFKPKDAAGAIRVSFGYQNSIEEVNYALEVLQKLTKKFRIN